MKYFKLLIKNNSSLVKTNIIFMIYNINMISISCMGIGNYQGMCIFSLVLLEPLCQFSKLIAF